MGQHRSHTDAEVIDWFQKAVRNVCQRKLGGLSAETRVVDLGLDSVATLEVIGYLEEQLEVRISDDQMAGVQTLGELSALINRDPQRP